MIVVDTNVISEFMKSEPSSTVMEWARSRPASELYTTSITLAEVRYGVERLADGSRKLLLRKAAEDVFVAYRGRVLSFDTEAAARYAQVMCGRERAGRPVEAFDAQIAAICRSHNAALATRNLKDFHATGIELLDPWHPVS